jgi:predicted MFS family arabinose efflux permease
VWAALLGLGAATGLLAGGAITETVGWRWVFFINVPIGLAVLAAAGRVLPADPPRAARAGLDAPGAVLATGGLLVLVYSIVESHERGWGSAWTLGGLALGAALLVGFAIRERAAGDPLLPPALARRRSVAASNAVMLVTAGGLFAMFFFVSLYMQVVQGWSPLRAGVSFLGFTLAFGATSGVATKLVQRVAPRVMLPIGLAVAAGGMLALTRLQPDSGYWETLLPAIALCGIGLGLGFVPLTAAATSGIDGRDAGLVSGLLSTCQQVGGAIGIAVLVTLASDRTADAVASGVPQLQALTDGFHLAFTVNAGLLLAAALVAPLIGRVRVTGVPVRAASTTRSIPTW